MSSKQRFTRPASSGPRRDRKSRRNVVVLASLLGSLVATSLLLIALAPAPLAPDALTLVAIDEESSFEQIFATRVPVAEGRWTQIFIHQSRTRGGNALTLGQQGGGMGDHFLIGNGIDCADGAIQIGHRWNAQQAATPQGARVAEGCISICLVGDLDQSPPTAAQLLRLEQLVRVLQRRLDVRGKDVVVTTQPGSTAGIGSRFPLAQLSAAVLP